MGVDFRLINKRGEQKIKGRSVYDQMYSDYWQSRSKNHHRAAARRAVRALKK